MPKKNNRPKQDVKPILHIFCEGEKTEPNYINGYLDKFFPTNRRLKVIKIESTRKNTPKQLVDEAAGAQMQSPEWDAFWVVYDRESELKYSERLHAEAYNKAKKNGISVALTNVCFEVWLLLHFQKTCAPYSDYDNLKKNSALRNECQKRGISDYDKGDQSVFRVLKEDEIKAARGRAEIMNRQTMQSSESSRAQPYQWNPYTDVYKLLDAIDEIAQI
ncbi:RloB family protein [Methylotuvimicrobium sp. KM2]|uniref:RloB family protein n=1 Tax=Methylotuvimicrobium sp. KM2 TaxID=3133976 RepID=UPI003100F097